MNDPALWRGESLRDDSLWCRPISAAQSREISRAVERVAARGLGPADLGESDFPLPALRETIAHVRDELEHGRGFVVLRGLPVAGRDLAGLERLAIGLGLQLGDLLEQQNGVGGRIDVVADRGHDYGNAGVKGYETRAALSPHCDSGDVVGLLCVRPAKLGGVTSIASFAAIHEEIAATRPALLEPLYRGFHYNIRGGGPPGPWQDVTRHRVPVFVRRGERLAGRFNGRAIRTAPQFPGVAPLTALELAAIERVEQLAVRPDLRLDMTLEPGDLQLLSNHAVIHTRSAFEDWEEPERKRLLLRLWINDRSPCVLPDAFTDHYNTGPRCGPFVRAAGTEPATITG